MSLARSYAQALYQSATEAGAQAGAIDQFEREFIQFLEAAGSSKEAKIAIYSPIVTTKEKTAIIEAIAEKFQFSRPMTNFLILLARKGRLTELAKIQESFLSVRTAAEGGLSGLLSSAEALSPEDIKELARWFTQKLGKPVTFRASTDPELLAGIKVTVNGVTYDGTLRAQLQQLRDRLVTGAVVSSPVR